MLWHLLLRVMRSPQVPVAAGLLPVVVEPAVAAAAVAAVVAVVAVVVPLVPDRPERRRARSRWS